MKISGPISTGISFGLTSGIITTLGLIVGLHAGTHSKISVIGGILTIAIADAFSDALGIHISQESRHSLSAKEIWIATVTTWLTKFFFAITFLIPVIIFELNLAIYISVVWGFLILGIESYIIGKKESINPLSVVAEHLGIALIVIITTNYLGGIISKTFGR